MSKLSFRARALDATKQMPIFKAEDIPDLPDFAAINRAVPQMPTGMEKEEETEHHLQRALTAQQVYGTAEALEIPVPEVAGVEAYNALYKGSEDFTYKPPKQFVHVQAFGVEHDIPDYDMDSEDEQWLTKQTKKMEVTPVKFEEMMDRLEKSSGQQVLTLQEAKLLLKEDDDLIIAVYDYWLNKRLRTVSSHKQHGLIPQVKTEKRDGSTTNNPYVAFRRRTEKMQTRKNRKNDEASYEKMLKLKRDLNRALTLLEIIKRREKSKKELLQLTVEVVDKRYALGDFEGRAYDHAMSQRHIRPQYFPLPNNWSRDENYVRKKREYRKRKHKNSVHLSAPSSQSQSNLPVYTEVDILNPDMYSSEEEISPPLSASDHEDENDPDGIYGFKRKAGCNYLAPIPDGLGNWSWAGQEEGGFGDKKYRYSLTSLSIPRRSVGFARRRVGRGGRIILDRASTAWDDGLFDLDFTSSGYHTPNGLQDYPSYIKERKILHFRPGTPTDEPLSPTTVPFRALSPIDTVPTVTEFNIESFHDHQEQLIEMQRQQQEQLLKQTDLDSSFSLEHSFSSQPTSKFTLDSATAQFAASAVVSTTQSLSQLSDTTNTVTTTTVTLNGPITDPDGTSCFSISPAASVLQLNYPIMPQNATIPTPVSIATGPVSIATGLSSPSPVSVLATKAVTPTHPVTNLLKVGSTANNNALPKDDHDTENTTLIESLVKEKVAAMEVT
ncbi:unnamed protein product [Owenia fusiformis]|uniref:Enhancer of polycomb-like protein n=1 Tax=Owenia fusiformis TaxID=6347 RepID=A0A8S4N195_OWEFU|nr:unnamed protein product [Owenia fusiformis]